MQENEKMQGKLELDALEKVSGGNLNPSHDYAVRAICDGDVYKGMDYSREVIYRYKKGETFWCGEGNAFYVEKEDYWWEWIDTPNGWGAVPAFNFTRH